MNRKKFFNILSMVLSTVLVVLSFSTAQAVHYTISSGRSVEAKADTLYEMVKKELDFTKKAKDKFQQIRTVLSGLKQLLQSDEIKTEEIEYVQQYIVALESLPSPQGFKKNKCGSYEVSGKARDLLEKLCN